MDDGQEVHSQGGSYNEKESFAGTVFQVVLMIIALILTMSFTLVGLIFVILGIRKSLSREVMEVTVPEFIAGASYVMSFVSLSLSALNLSGMGTANFWTVSFFIFPILAVVASAVGLVMAIRNFGKIRSRAMAIYLLIVAIGAAFFGAYLWANGMVGIGLWWY
jgi:hypothetical protein